jgi:hypothetical protein
MKKLILAAALLSAVGARAVRADDVPAPAPAKSIQWIEGWEAGREAARKSGKLMFVYVHRVNPG